jgi:hypothetical protein
MFDQRIIASADTPKPAQWHRIAVHNEYLGAYAVQKLVKKYVIYKPRYCLFSLHINKQCLLVLWLHLNSVSYLHLGRVMFIPSLFQLCCIYWGWYRNQDLQWQHWWSSQKYTGDLYPTWWYALQNLTKKLMLIWFFIVIFENMSKFCHNSFHRSLSDSILYANIPFYFIYPTEHSHVVLLSSIRLSCASTLCKS